MISVVVEFLTVFSTSVETAATAAGFGATEIAALTSGAIAVLFHGFDAEANEWFVAGVASYADDHQYFDFPYSGAFAMSYMFASSYIPAEFGYSYLFDLAMTYKFQIDDNTWFKLSGMATTDDNTVMVTMSNVSDYSMDTLDSGYEMILDYFLTFTLATDEDVSADLMFNYSMYASMEDDFMSDMLAVAYYDTDDDMWMVMDDVDIDADTMTMTYTTAHFSTWIAVYGESSDSSSAFGVSMVLSALVAAIAVALI